MDATRLLGEAQLQQTDLGRQGSGGSRRRGQGWGTREVAFELKMIMEWPRKNLDVVLSFPYFET